jgi:titin
VAQSGDNFVVLTWSPPTNPGNPEFTQYDIYRTPESAGTELIANVPSGTLTFNDTTAVNGNIYEYYVKSVNTVGSSPASNSAIGSPTEPGTAPGAPTSLTAEAISGHILLGWTAPSGGGVSNYLIYRGTTAGGEGATPIAKVSLGTIYQDDNVVAGTTYFYKVKANNTFGMSDFSNEASATIESIVPSAPQNLVATPGEGKVTLTWEAPADDGGSSITGYNIYRGEGSATPVFLGSVGASTLTYEDTSGTAGTTYAYFVVATNINGAGQESAPVNAESETPSEDGGGMDTTTLLLIGVVAVIAIIAIAYFLMRRKP